MRTIAMERVLRIAGERIDVELPVSELHLNVSNSGSKAGTEPRRYG